MRTNASWRGGICRVLPFGRSEVAGMPQRPKQKPIEQQSRFVQLLFEYMWRQRPPLKTAADLAYHVEMSRQTIYQWLHKNVEPQPGTLMLFVQRTNMTPDEIRDIFTALHYPVPFAIANADADITSLAALHRLAEEDVSLTEPQRRIVLRWLLGISRASNDAPSADEARKSLRASI